MDFCYALNALREGKRVARKGWNGKGMFIYLVGPGKYGPTTVVAFEYFKGEVVPYRPYIAMKTVDEDVVPWVASQTDLLESDWSIVEGFKGGCHSYWVNALITNNPDAKCDISGETDKRFLVLHHLYSRDNKKEVNKDAYVVLSANYHMAFHVWNGGTNVSCTPEKYYEFKRQELGGRSFNEK